MTEHDGPSKGDLQLLRVLIEKQTVVKPTVKNSGSPRKRAGRPMTSRKGDQKEKKLVDVLKVTMGMEFNKKIAT